MPLENRKLVVQELIKADNHLRRCVANLLPPMPETEAACELCATDWFAALSQRFGFTHYLAGRFAPSGDASLQDLALASNWTEEFMVQQISWGDFGSSIALAVMNSSTFPLIRRNKDLFDLADLQHDGMAAAEMATMLVSMHNTTGRRYFFMLSAPAARFYEIDKAATYFGIMEFVERHTAELALSGARVIPLRKKQLSGREIECLRWAAEGKTTDVIATILGISSHTVNLYFQSAIDKLSAVNRTQAVAKAMRMGAI